MGPAKDKHGVRESFAKVIFLFAKNGHTGIKEFWSTTIYIYTYMYITKKTCRCFFWDWFLSPKILYFEEKGTSIWDMPIYICIIFLYRQIHTYIYHDHTHIFPVVPHKAVAEVSKIGNLYCRRDWLLWIRDGRANPLMDRKVLEVSSLSLSFSDYLPTYQPIFYVSIDRSIYLSLSFICLAVYLSIHPSIYLSVCLSVDLSICGAVSFSVM